LFGRDRVFQTVAFTANAVACGPALGLTESTSWTPKPWSDTVAVDPELIEVDVVVELDEVEAAEGPPDITNALVTVMAIPIVNARSTYVLNDELGLAVSKPTSAYPIHSSTHNPNVKNGPPGGAFYPSEQADRGLLKVPRPEPGSDGRRRAVPSRDAGRSVYYRLQVAVGGGLNLHQRLRLLHPSGLRDARHRLFDRLLVLSFYSHDCVEGPEDQVHLRDGGQVPNLENTRAVGIAVNRDKDERSFLD
jgi:hypothetical protein